MIIIIYLAVICLNSITQLVGVDQGKSPD